MSRTRLTALALLLAVIGYALLVPALDPGAGHAVDLQRVYLAPGAGHWFGTDQLGRDIWVRAAQALRLSLLLAACSALASTVLGVLGGLAAATAGGLADRLVMRAVDTVNAIPHLLLGVVVLALFPGSQWAIIASIALTHWTQVARVVRSKLVAEREAGWVRLARAGGARPAMIWCTHLVPAVLPQAGIALVLQLPHAIWHESALSFLGVGLPPESASLGLLLEDARGGILVDAWWLLAFPAALLVLVSWSIAVFAHPAPAPRRAGKRHGKPRPRLGRQQEQRRADGSSHAALQARNLSVWSESGDTPDALLRDVDYRALAGAVNVILGPSGAGKTLLLRALSGLLPDSLGSSGQVCLAGRPRSARRLAAARGRDLVFIPGSAATALNPVRTVGAALARMHRRHRLDASGPALAAALAELDLSPEVLRRYPHELSGGQAQRAALALGLATGAHCILLDEPTSALDRQARHYFERVVRRLAAQGRTVIMVTHDRDLAAQVGDRVTLLDSGQILYSGPAAALLHDAQKLPLAPVEAVEP